MRRPEVAADVEVRPARPGDAGSFLALWAEVAAEGLVRADDPSPTPAEVRRRFRRPWTEAEAELVAVEGRRVVGHVVVVRERHAVTRHVATLAIAVAADRRRRGIGTALLARALEWARAQGVEKLILSVYPHNEAAIALYRRFGFVEEGRLARHSRTAYGDLDEILMAAWIGRRDEERGAT